MERETDTPPETQASKTEAAISLKAVTKSEKIKKVALIGLGEESKINLKRLARKLNSLQKTFYFAYQGNIEGGKIGNPAVENLYYDFIVLFEKINLHLSLPDHDFVIAVTDYRITDANEPPPRFETRDYFSNSDGKRLSLVSTNDKIYIYNPKLKNEYHYTAYQIASELLINTTKQDLMHARSDGCLFDDCEQRETFRRSIKESFICSTCANNLRDLHVDGQIIEDVQKILDYCRKNDSKNSLIKALLNPITTLFVGAWIGWLLSLISLSQGSPSLVITVAILVTLTTLLIPLIIFIYFKLGGKWDT
jgi:translation initiation factor 1 (eIF-1/SUI1)